MDNCFLESLTVKPGKLKPPFKRSITEYSVVVSSSVAKVAVDGFTEDGGASWVVQGQPDRDNVPLSEGRNELIAEVTSEDGSAKKEYVVVVKRLSASLAALNGIKLTAATVPVTLRPPFSKENHVYYATVVPWTSALAIKCLKPESKTQVTISTASAMTAAEADQSQNPALESNEGTVDLALGQTDIIITVTSPNGQQTATYTVYVEKNPIATPLLPFTESKACLLNGATAVTAPTKVPTTTAKAAIATTKMGAKRGPAKRTTAGASRTGAKTQCQRKEPPKAVAVALMPMSNVVCPVCFNILHNPVLFTHPAVALEATSKASAAHHTVCTTCFYNICKPANVCPLDGCVNTGSNFKVSAASPALLAEMFATKVHCPFSRNGCSVAGELKELAREHVQHCAFRPAWHAPTATMVASANVTAGTSSSPVTTEALFALGEKELIQAVLIPSTALDALNHPGASSNTNANASATHTKAVLTKAQTPCPKCSKVVYCVRGDDNGKVGPENDPIHQVTCPSALKENADSVLSLRKGAGSKDLGRFGENAWEKLLQANCRAATEDVKGATQSVARKRKQYASAFAAHYHDRSKGVVLMNALEEALAVACAASMKHPKVADFHFSMGEVLEETIFIMRSFEDIAKDPSSSTTSCSSGNGERSDTGCDDGLCVLADQGTDSSKMDDINALCGQHGVDAAANIAQKLKVIDREYHGLKEKGLFHRADYVQTLYLFLSSQARKSAASCNGASNTSASTGGPASSDASRLHDEILVRLRNVLHKYLDACEHQPSEGRYFYHAGRIAQQLGLAKEARALFAVAVSLRPTSLYARWRYAQVFREDLGDAVVLDTFKETIAAANFAQSALWKEKQLVAHDAFLHINGELFPTYGLAASMSESVAEKERFLKEGISFIIRTLNLLPSRNSSLYSSLFMQLLGLCEQLGMLARQIGDTQQALSLFSYTLSLVPKGSELAFSRLRTRLAEKCVQISPNSPRPLCQLGWNFVEQYEIGDDDAVLDEATLFFDAAWEAATNPGVHNASAPKSLQASTFWKSLSAATGTKSPAKVEKKTAPAQRSAKPKAVPGKSSARPTARTPSSSSSSVLARNSRTKAPPPKRVSPRRTPPPQSAKYGRKASAIGNKLPPIAKTGGVEASSRSKTSTTTASSATDAKAKKAHAFLRTNERQQPERKGKLAPTSSTAAKGTVTKKPEESSSSREVPLAQRIEIKRGQGKVAMLRLERAKTAKDSNEKGGNESQQQQQQQQQQQHQLRGVIKECYGFVIEHAAHDIDAYVEYGAHLVRDGLVGEALALYDAFPFSEATAAATYQPSDSQSQFDQAFLHGEFVSLVFKSGNLDHPALQKHLTGLGRALGLRTIEDYIDKLDESGKYTTMLKEVYAAVNNKSVDDKDLQPFFKFKCWI